MLRIFSKVFLIFLVLLVVYSPVKVFAAALKFDSATYSIKPGEKKQVTVVLDTEGKNVFGAVATLKITAGSDVIKINSVTASSQVGYNEMRVTDATSSGDSRVSFTVIKEVGSYFTGVSNLAVLEVEGLKSGSATLKVVTDDPEPSTVADYDTNNELLSTLGTATFNTTSSNTGSSNNDDDNDDEDNDNDGDNNDDSDSNSSSSNSSSTTTSTTQIPETGSDYLLYIFILSILSIFGAVISKRFIKS